MRSSRWMSKPGDAGAPPSSHAGALPPRAAGTSGASHRARIVVMVGSAGSLPVVREILLSLPPTFPLAIVIVLHRSPRHRDLLPPLVQRWTRLPVRRARDGATVEPGTVYVAPANRHVHIAADATIALSDGKRIQHVLSSGDPLFETAATAFGGGVVAVVLSGNGKNGAAGVRAVKAAGGTVLVQSEATAAYAAMPRAAVATGAVDRVLRDDEIGPALVRLARGEAP